MLLFVYEFKDRFEYESWGDEKNIREQNIKPGNALPRDSAFFHKFYSPVFFQ